MRTGRADTLNMEASADTTGASGTHVPFSVWRIAQSMPHATPSQLDSAIQANLPKRERFLSTRPDTLNLPGMQGRSLIPNLDSLDKCYTLSFFSDNPMLHPELVADTPGYAAEPLSYNLRNDGWITGSLLCIFFFLAIYIRYIWRYICVQARFFSGLISQPHLPTHEIKTGVETHYSLVIITIQCLMYSLIFYGYTQQGLQLFLGQLSPYTLMGNYFVYFFLYFGIRRISYSFVNYIFFDKTRQNAWRDSDSFLIFAEMTLLFPLLVILVYFNISDQKSLYFILFLFIFVKTIHLFKTYRILFNNLYCLLHFFVYFCALEIIPMVIIWTALTQITNSLIVIF